MKIGSAGSRAGRRILGADALREVLAFREASGFSLLAGGPQGWRRNAVSCIDRAGLDDA